MERLFFATCMCPFAIYNSALRVISQARSTLPRFRLLLFGQVLKFLCSPACNENSFLCGDFCSLDTLAAGSHGTLAIAILSLELI